MKTEKQKENPTKLKISFKDLFDQAEDDWQRLTMISLAKEYYIRDQDFMLAAKLRDIEKKLRCMCAENKNLGKNILKINNLF